MKTSDVYPQWDPDRIFPNSVTVDGEEIFNAVAERASRLSRATRHRIADLDAPGLLEAIRQYESCICDLQLLTSYAELLYALNEEGTSVALLNRCDTAWAELATELGFFEQELAARDDLKNADLGPYAHFVHKTHVEAARKLPESEEMILARLLPTGGEGWQRLARELLARITVDVGGRRCGVGEAMSDLFDPDRTAREAAHVAISAALEGELGLRATVLSMIVADGEERARLRGGGWLDARYAIDQVGQAEVDALLTAAEDCVPVIHDYYEFKRARLGLETLTAYDRYAPLSAAEEIVSWGDAVKIVISAFHRIDPELGDIATRVVDEGRVDAVPRTGKQRNAYTLAVPGRLPCVSVNFTGGLRDVLVLGHEMGHAVHMHLAAGQPLLAANPAPVVAESVALFCEAVTVQALLAAATDQEQQASCLARWLEDQMVSAGRHAAMHTFEAELREAARSGRTLDAALMGDLWLDGQSRLYGPAIELTGDYRAWWSFLDPLFADPGSNYSYVYGQLCALTLLGRFEEDPAAFAPSFKELLRSGDTRPPADLFAAIGVRTAEADDWRTAVAALRNEVTHLRALVAADPLTSVLGRKADGKSTPSGRKGED